jgi:hypothetical protein
MKSPKSLYTCLISPVEFQRLRMVFFYYRQLSVCEYFGVQKTFAKLLPMLPPPMISTFML